MQPKKQVRLGALKGWMEIKGDIIHSIWTWKKIGSCSEISAGYPRLDLEPGKSGTTRHENPARIGQSGCGALCSPISTLEKANLHAETIGLTHEIAWDAYNLPGKFHNDPADRVLVATARLERLTLTDCGRFDSKISARKNPMRDYLTVIHKNVRSTGGAFKAWKAAGLPTTT